MHNRQTLFDTAPPGPARRPAPERNFSLYIRAYWPQNAIVNGEWTPPAIKSAR
jgi:hypothetical protein